MAKEIYFKEEARDEISKGVQKLTDAVSATMGPKGRNVFIHKEGQRPFITKDGVTVAQEVFLKDKLQDMAAQVVKEASANTAFEAGDGTTTSVVSTNAILQLGLEAVKDGADPISIKRGMDSMTDIVVKELEENAKEVSDEDIFNVATISANGDVEIGRLIADAIENVGRDGIITVEEGLSASDELVLSEGLELNRGYLSPHFVTNPDKDRAELDDVFLLISEDKVSQLVTILPILEQVQKTGKPLLIIADDVDGEALSSIVVNKIRGTLNVSAIKAPGFGSEKLSKLKDIALLTGATLIGSETGKTLETLVLADLGVANRVLINKNTTVIVEGQGDKIKIKEALDSLRKQIENQKDEELKTQLQKRLTGLNGKAAVIKVGAQTEFEMTEKKDRFDDAVEATKSAIEEGIVIGGGCAFIHIGLKYYNKLKHEKGTDFEKGEGIILLAITSTMKQILKNAGKIPEVISDIIHLLEAKDIESGYNAVTNQIENLFETGIIDPLKVERIALINANSIASTLLTTDVAIFEEKKED